MKKIINLIKKNKFPIILSIISIISIIIGWALIGLVSSFLIVLFLDTIAILLHKPRKKKKKLSKKEKVKEVFKSLFIVGFICTILLLLLGISFLGYIIYSAPEFTTENLYNKDATFLYTSDGVEFAKLGTEIRQKISYDDLSQSLIDAIIATEDSRYFQHSGVDLPRFIKASISQVLGKGGGGASTITMQLSKLAFTSTESEGIEGIIRKFSDIYLSVFKIETNYTKEQILEFYVNRNYLGGGTTGVEQASLQYFGKSASELNIAESAMIAGLFQAPVGYDPYDNPEGCESRRKEVLSLMLRHGYINQEEYEIAKELSVDKLLVEHEDSNSGDYQAFIDTVVDEVIEKTGYDPYKVPMKIYTTMNVDMQDNMNDIMNGVTYTWKDELIQAGSVILDVKTGAISAVGAGRNRPARGTNRATSINRQIGSTAKPLYDYGPAIEYYNWSTYTPFADEPHTYSDGKTNMNNWDKKYEYFITLHDALKYSRNVPALKTFQTVDNKKIKQFVTNLNLNPELEGSDYVHEAHSVGAYPGESPLTLAAAYAAFSNGGYYIEPHSFTIIEFTETGETFEQKPTTKRVMSIETAYMITKILENTSGYAVGYLSSGANYAAKTGTSSLTNETIKNLGYPSNAINDKWIASYNDSYAITLWYGYDQSVPNYYTTMSETGFKTVFKLIANKVYTKKSTWTKPKGVVEVTVENELPTAMLASENTPDDLKFKAYFKKGFEPTETSTRFQKLSNVANLKYDESTNTLSWDSLKNPDYLDETYLTNMYKSLFKDSKSLKKQVESVLEYNTKNVGTITYDIYVKDSNGELVYINSTDTNSYIYPIKESTTFVVKTNYTILKDCESTGSEFTITKTPIVITSSLNGESNINLKIGETYVEPANPVIVLENGLNDITNNCNVTISVKRSSDNQIFDNISMINTSTVDTYTITYNITYNEYTNTLIKTINITE